jgi:hypothetical protein
MIFDPFAIFRDLTTRDPARLETLPREQGIYALHVLTKYDAVLAAGLADRVNTDFDAIINSLRRRFSGTFSAIEGFVTSASPKSSKAARGAGLAELLSFWLKPIEIRPVPLQPVQSSRVFNNLQPAEA